MRGGRANRQRGDVIAPAQQLDIRMTADHAGRGARHIEQDAVERFAVPPRRRLAGIGRDDLRSHSQPLQVLRDARQPLGRNIDRRQRSKFRRQLEQVTCFATRRGAGVENALARLRFEQMSRELRRCVLHRNQSLVESR